MEYTKYLRWGIIGGLFFLLFLPFLIANGSLLPNMFFPYITGKNFTFRIVVEIIVALYAILALREPKYCPKGSYLMWAALAFVVWMGIASLVSVDPIKTFWSNFERMEGYVTVLHLFALFVVAGAVLNEMNLWRRFFQTSVALSAIQGVYAIFQVMHVLGLAPSSQSGARADTTFGNATYLAVYMLFNIFITLFLLVRESRSKGMQAVYGIALVLQLAALYFTETRGSILGVLGGFVLAALYLAWRARGSELRWYRRLSFVTLGTIAILVVGFIALKDTSFIRNAPALSRLASISLTDGTTQSRFIIWNVAYQGFLERPAAGWGQENFSYVFNEHYSPEMYAQEQWFDRAHNQFLDWLIAGGLPAFILYISLFVLGAWAIIRSEALLVPEQAVLIGLLGGYAFNNIFVFDNILSIVYFFLILAFVHSISNKQLPAWMFLSRPLSDRAVSVAAPIIGIVVLVGGWMLNGPAMARAQTMIEAFRTTNATGAPITPQDKLASFKKAVTQGELGKQETIEQLFQFASGVGSDSNLAPEVKEEIYTFTRAQGEAFLASRPNDARLESFMGLFLAQYGKYEDAITHLNKAIALSPDKQSILFQLGQTYLQQGDLNNALPIFKKAYELAPQFITARLMYAGALYFAQQTKAADALLNEQYGTIIVDNDQLLKIYQSLGLHDRVIQIWNLRVGKDPKNPDIYLGLASAYFTAGNLEATIATLQKVAGLNPAAAAEIQAIITQLQAGTLLPSTVK
ncbi:O-antigen ligase family protein [Acetobacteraceae bacterium]|nr:O-antigen ligase family protein [Candidatus Parcubacteria bacterium]